MTVEANYREWHFASKLRGLPKQDCPPGPWDQEPDKVQWIDEATGLDCLIVRGPMGALCGYVGVMPGHPFYGMAYGEPDVSVHGGLTFADLCEPGEPVEGICHVPAEGRDPAVWWLGFDCGHCFDLVPGQMAFAERLGLSLYRDCVYRDVEYVRMEVRSLARQLALTQ